jgi:ketopantoate reductase
MARVGLGRRTRQFNPQSEGARTLAQWVIAVLAMKGESDAMEPAAAVEIIRATPPERRSKFAQQIWRLRRTRGTDRWASG